MSDLFETLNKHETNRNTNLNLVASENALSDHLRRALSSDLAGRYSSMFYGGSSLNRKIIQLAEELSKELFNVDFACVLPISGHLCDLAAINALSNNNEKIAIVSSPNGGYPVNLVALERREVNIPFEIEKWEINYTSLDNFYNVNQPSLSIIGSSVIPYPYDLQRIQDASSIVDNHEIVYDGSHVLGLIAGGEFQNPISEGADVLIGSTHKSFFGPQGGLILGNNERVFEKIAFQFSLQTHDNPFEENSGTVLVDNVHSNRIAGLCISLIEMLEFGSEYSKQIVKNSNALANELYNLGFPITKNGKHSFTQSHQIIMPMSPSKGMAFKCKLEEAGIYVDSFVRLGTSELTRRGYKETDMRYIAELISLIINEDEAIEKIQQKIIQLTNEYNKLHYCFDDIMEFPF